MRFSVLVTPRQRDELDRLAAEADRPRTYILRQIIDIGLEHLPEKTAVPA